MLWVVPSTAQKFHPNFWWEHILKGKKKKQNKKTRMFVSPKKRFGKAGGLKIRSDICLLQHIFCWTLFLRTPNLLLWHECFTFLLNWIVVSQLKCRQHSRVKNTQDPLCWSFLWHTWVESLIYLSRHTVICQCPSLNILGAGQSADTEIQGFLSQCLGYFLWYSQGLYLPMYFAYTYFK